MAVLGRRFPGELLPSQEVHHVEAQIRRFRVRPASLPPRARRDSGGEALHEARAAAGRARQIEEDRLNDPCEGRRAGEAMTGAPGVSLSFEERS